MAKIQYRWQFNKRGSSSPLRLLPSVIVLGLIFYFIWVIVFMGVLWN